jgi:hypothetical protein
MAKARRPAKKGSSKSSSRPKAARKSVKASKARKTKKAARPVRQIELKKLREQFAVVLAVLSSRRSAAPEVESKLDDARRRISQWMTDVDDICTPELQEICGPDMAFPMP